MVIRKFKIKVISRGGRLRAVLTSADERYHFGEWWIESASHVRYKPLKPAPPKVMAILGMLPDHKLRKIGEFLMVAENGDEYVFEIQ